MMYNEKSANEIYVGQKLVYGGDTAIHPEATYDATVVGITDRLVTLEIDVRQETIREPIASRNHLPYKKSISKWCLGKTEFLETV